jgi:hypothetical protein
LRRTSLFDHNLFLEQVKQRGVTFLLGLDIRGTLNKFQPHAVTISLRLKLAILTLLIWPEQSVLVQSSCEPVLFLRRSAVYFSLAKGVEIVWHTALLSWYSPVRVKALPTDESVTSRSPEDRELH